MTHHTPLASAMTTGGTASHGGTNNVPLLRGYAASAAFIGGMLFSGFFGTAFLVCPVLPVLLLVKGGVTRWMQFLVDKYLGLCVALLELLCGLNVRISGDHASTGHVIDPNENALIMMNHPSEIDWFFLFNITERIRTHAILRIVLKSSLKLFPGVGWCMQLLPYAFVERVWEHDKETLTSVIRDQVLDRGRIQLVIFPEGTALYHKSLARSQAFMKEQGMEPWQRVLYPRTKGFCHCLQELRTACAERKMTCAIYDITLSYPELWEGRRPTPIRLAKGLFPERVDMHVQRFASSDLPSDEDGVSNWLLQRFQDKEDRLAQYSRTRTFGGHVSPIPLSFVRLWTLLLAWLLINLSWFVLMYHFPLLWLWVCFCSLCFVGHYYATKTSTGASTQF